MQNETTQSHALTVIICLLIIVLGIFYFSRREDALTITESSTQTQVETETSTASTLTEGSLPADAEVGVVTATTTAPCGLVIDSPAANDAVTFPITVRGHIDNSKAADGCRWIVFEAQAGSAQLYIDNAGLSWDPVGKPVTIEVPDWAPTNTKFTTVINYNNKGVGVKSGTKFKIRFQEEDPSGLKQVQIIDLPVELK